jgi:hypothetical protein
LYNESLAKSVENDLTYTQIKAVYGLGLLNLIGAEFDVPGYSYLSAQDYFTQTLLAYDAAGTPLDLRRYAADAHAMLGRAWLNQANLQRKACALDRAARHYDQALLELRRAVQILEELHSTSVAAWLARYQAWIGHAEKDAAIQPERATRLSLPLNRPSKPAKVSPKKSNAGQSRLSY